MDPPGIKRRLTCILAADAVGYSRHVSDDEGLALRVLAAHRAVIDGIIAFHDGRIVSTAGDSVLAEFHSAVEAVRCAVEIQDALRTRNEALPEAQRMPFRIGINLGDVVVKGDDLLGDGVNVAARLESAAQPGGILIASSVYDQITGKLDLAFEDMGEQSLKNISRPIRAFSVSGAGGTIRPLPTRPPAPAAAPAPPRRLGPIAIVAIVAMGAVAVLAVTQGWLKPPKPPVDAAKAKLEADLAAAEKARVEAEQRAKASDADAIRARAEMEAAALRAKAETEAAATKAKAQADAAQLRAQAAAEANRAKAAPPPPARPAVAATSYDGAWNVRQQCASVQGSPPFNREATIIVTTGEFVLVRGKPGEPGWGELRGKPAADGTLVLSGGGISAVPASYGAPFDSRFDGAWTGDRFRLKGRLGARPCLIELERRDGSSPSK